MAAHRVVFGGRGRPPLHRSTLIAGERTRRELTRVRNPAVPDESGLRPRPASSWSRQGSHPARRSFGREVTLLFTTGEKIGCCHYEAGERDGTARRRTSRRRFSFGTPPLAGKSARATRASRQTCRCSRMQMHTGRARSGNNWPRHRTFVREDSNLLALRPCQK